MRCTRSADKGDAINVRMQSSPEVNEVLNVGGQNGVCDAVKFEVMIMVILKQLMTVIPVIV